MIGKRITTAILWAAYLVLVVYLGGWYYNVSVLILMLISLNEIYRAMDHAALKPLRYIGYLFTLLLLPTLLLKGITGIFMLFTLFALGTIASMLFKSDNSFTNVLVTIFSLIYPILPLTFLILIKYLQPSSVGIIALTLAFISSWATDTFAYFTGITLGKHKLYPRISPNKTIEGSIGGLLGSVIISIILGFFIQHYMYKPIELFHFGVIGLLSGIFAQVGDFSASAIKRYSGIKDFGSFFPGHGGVLDRFDSVLFTVPIVYCYFILLIIK